MIAYTLANPTAAGLVDDPSRWPGVITPLCGITQTVVRPRVFFRENGNMPASLELNVVPPELQAQGDAQAVLARIRAALDEKLRVARQRMVDEGRTFVGRKGVLATSRKARASTPEPTMTRQPRIAARRIEPRRSAFNRLRAFRVHYAHALRAWRAGDRTVVFPAGTYAMRVRHGVRVDAPPG